MATDDMRFIIGSDTFSLSSAALSTLGPACMLNQMLEDAGEGNEHIVSWPAPLTVRAFALVVEWATHAQIPADITALEVAELFRAADALAVPALASLALARGPPPSTFDSENYCLLEVETSYFVDVEPATFVARHRAVDRPLALSDLPLLFQQQHVDRAQAPLFNTTNAVTEMLEQKLPPEARICLAQGLCMAGGFIGRLAASLAGLREVPLHAQPRTTRPDIDFFVTTADSVEALRIVRATLIALARHCEEHQYGMCVVRSAYAVTVAMDDCDFDLQIILCAFDSMEDVLVNFDIDACRVAYDGSRLVASETFLRAIVSGTIIARPQNESANHAKRLHKYATELGYTIAIADHDPGSPGKTFKQLKEWEAAWMAAPPPPGPLAAPPTKNPYAGIRTLREWEEPWGEDDYSDGDAEPADDPTTASGRYSTNPAIKQLAETEAGPTWTGKEQSHPYVPPPVKQPRLKREVVRQNQFAYSSSSSRHVVEIWRGQRRRPRADGDPYPDSESFWRYESSAQLAHTLGTGSVRWHRPDDGNDSDKPDYDANVFCMKDVVFQQLDMHPVQGAWNATKKAHLATASDAQPLLFLNFIEDAALVVPKACREKLPRCLQVPTREEAGSSLFNRPPVGAANWLPEDPPPPPPPPPEREDGTVARWNEQRGFGFIRTLAGEDRCRGYETDVFCHMSDIEDGNCLRPGSAVSFVSFFDRQKGKERAVQVRGGVMLPNAGRRGVR
tara:strand:- start:1122 stop:3317 length:2196 start_codon:yes stop_codon:yes gene_type:complete